MPASAEVLASVLLSKDLMARKSAPRRADPWGIAPGYVDASGDWRPLRPDARRALLACMGADPKAPPPASAPVRVIRAGMRVAVEPGELVLEDGAVLPIRHVLPRDVPPGYHHLRSDSGETRVIVTPAQCPAPAGRIWGWAAQLYAARSSESWGIGDLADLRRLGHWSAGLGARLLLINPLYAPLPLRPQQPSPYFPSSRRFRNPLYLRIEEVPGAREAALELEPLARAGRALNSARRIDRDAIQRLKDQALAILWTRFGSDRAFDDWRQAQGRALTEFATFCALAERHGSGWSRWPGEFKRPDSPAVEAFRRTNADRVRYHEWLQWLLDVQLARAAAACPITQDLPIGVDPDGADAWAWQDVLAIGAAVGAPPDRYIKNGQNWGLPPFVPHRLRAERYEPFIQTIRATLRHAGGLRIDHVMGLFRLWWIPSGRTPAEGGYVRYPADDLLGIVALESTRAGAFAVGEDLGTVEAGVREVLARHCILSYRCLWFEIDPPARYPTLSLAAVTTHDLPTVAGLWTGSDVEAQRAIGLEPNTEALAQIRERVAALTALSHDAAPTTVIEQTHAILADAASVVVTATLEDALAIAERPNMPGTTTQWPNWSLALPQPLERLEESSLANTIAARLAARRPAPEEQS